MERKFHHAMENRTPHILFFLEPLSSSLRGVGKNKN